MPTTPLNHFREDISRARNLVGLAKQQPANTDAEKCLRNDVLRSAWMFGVGSLDAYFSDAYADMLTAGLIICANNSQADFTKFEDISVPVVFFARQTEIRKNWVWRMAARKKIERENFLKLETIRSRINRFLPTKKGLFSRSMMDLLLSNPQVGKRVFGIDSTTYIAIPTSQAKTAACTAAKEEMEKWMRGVFQRRHDCIHNCDRPKSRPQKMQSPTGVLYVLKHIELIITTSDQHIHNEFPNFLTSIGASRTDVILQGY